MRGIVENEMARTCRSLDGGAIGTRVCTIGRDEGEMNDRRSGTDRGKRSILYVGIARSALLKCIRVVINRIAL